MADEAQQAAVMAAMAAQQLGAQAQPQQQHQVQLFPFLAAGADAYAQQLLQMQGQQPQLSLQQMQQFFPQPQVQVQVQMQVQEPTVPDAADLAAEAYLQKQNPQQQQQQQQQLQQPVQQQVQQQAQPQGRRKRGWDDPEEAQTPGSMASNMGPPPQPIPSGGMQGGMQGAGGWVCSCGFRNKESNTQCGGNGPAGCNAPRHPGGVQTSIIPDPGNGRLPPVAGVDGNWICPACEPPRNVNFAGRKQCFRCNADKPVALGGGGCGSSGSGSHGGAAAFETKDDEIDSAAGTALASIAHLETEWDFDKLRWKVASYFRKAGASVSMQGSVEEVVDNLADTAFSNMSNLGDRAWLPQADFTLVLDITVKQCLPPELLAQVTSSVLQNHVLVAHDRAFDCTRVMPVLWQAVEKIVEGKRTQNKVYASLEAGRGEAMKALKSKGDVDLASGDIPVEMLPKEQKLEKFVGAWVNSTIQQIAKAHSGDPSTPLPIDIAKQLFQTLLQSDALPAALSRDFTINGHSFLPKPYPLLDKVLQEAYQTHTSLAKRQKTNQPKEELCWYFFYGPQNFCGFGDSCVCAHSEDELTPAARWAKGKGKGSSSNSEGCNDSKGEKSGKGGKVDENGMAWDANGGCLGKAGKGMPAMSKGWGNSMPRVHTPWQPPTHTKGDGWEQSIPRVHTPWQPPSHTEGSSTGWTQAWSESVGKW